MKRSGLTPAEQAHLCLVAQGRAPGCGEDAERRLLQQYDPLIRHLAGRVRLRLEFDDAIQEGRIAFLCAARGFDPARGVRFSTYCSAAIYNALHRVMHSTALTVRLSAPAHAQLRRMEEAETALTTRLGRLPYEDEVAAEAELTEARARDLRFAPRYRVSLESTCVGRNGELLHLGDILPEEGPLLADRVVEEDERRRLFDTAMAALTDQQRLIVGLRYGLDPHDRPHTLAEIAAICGGSAQHIHTTWKRAWRTMRDAAGALDGEVAAST